MDESWMSSISLADGFVTFCVVLLGLSVIMLFSDPYGSKSKKQKDED
ncbi:MAG: hypothetical protein G01um101419_333 [Parcubacteria group bacterium Gr01-1014_19]|nr:MAG: hypothetical protein G01um101419_333 [Parcubacteria group bacterium Gr01-1014_19]